MFLPCDLHQRVHFWAFVRFMWDTFANVLLVDNLHTADMFAPLTGKRAKARTSTWVGSQPHDLIHGHLSSSNTPDNIAALQHLTREIYEGDDNIVKKSTVYYVLLEWTNYCSCAADSMQGSGKGTFSERIRRSFFVLGFSLIETGSGWVDWKESYALFFHSVVRSAGAQIMFSWCSNCAQLVLNCAQLVLILCSNCAQLVLNCAQLANCAQLVLKLCSAGAKIVLSWCSNINVYIYIYVLQMW